MAGSMGSVGLRKVDQERLPNVGLLTSPSQRGDVSFVGGCGGQLVELVIYG